MKWVIWWFFLVYSKCGKEWLFLYIELTVKLKHSFNMSPYTSVFPIHIYWNHRLLRHTSSKQQQHSWYDCECCAESSLKINIINVFNTIILKRYQCRIKNIHAGTICYMLFFNSKSNSSLIWLKWQNINKKLFFFS